MAECSCCSSVAFERPNDSTCTFAPNSHVVQVCGPSDLACSVYIRWSRDGWHWGDPSDMGKGVVAPSGVYLAHSPVLALWASKGALLATAQMVMNANGE
jgi:hypothetical protein